jgi:hypothetical protein
MAIKILVCGSRESPRTRDDYAKIVWEKLEPYQGNLEIVEGCCPNSADEYAERWAEKNNIKVNHFPATEGNHLKRNIEMLNNNITYILAFWDGYSYGTAFTIAHAVEMNIPVEVINIGAKNK